MNTFRIRLRQHGAVATPLTMPTLWGHLAWGIRWQQGEPALRAWLDQYDTGAPPLILSDPLPAGYLPMPLLPPPPAPQDTADADAAKAARKRSWIAEIEWSAFAGSLSTSSAQGAAGQAGPPALIEQMVLHAGINRMTGGTQQASGAGALFAVSQHYAPSTGTDYDVWARFGGTADQLAALLEAGLHGGYGRDGATGMGHLSVHGVDAVDLPALARGVQPNAIMTLGRAVPAPGDPRPGFCRYIVHCGRLGGDYAVGGLPEDVSSIQKRPVHMIDRGSILLLGDGHTAAPAWIGRVLRGVHADLHEIRHCGMTLAVPVRLDAILHAIALQDAREVAA